MVTRWCCVAPTAGYVKATDFDWKCQLHGRVQDLPVPQVFQEKPGVLSVLFSGVLPTALWEIILSYSNIRDFYRFASVPSRMIQQMLRVHLKSKLPLYINLQLSPGDVFDILSHLVRMGFKSPVVHLNGTFDLVQGFRNYDHRSTPLLFEVLPKHGRIQCADPNYYLLREDNWGPFDINEGLAGGLSMSNPEVQTLSRCDLSFVLRPSTVEQQIQDMSRVSTRFPLTLVLDECKIGGYESFSPSQIDQLWDFLDDRPVSVVQFRHLFPGSSAVFTRVRSWFRNLRTLNLSGCVVSEEFIKSFELPNGLTSLDLRPQDARAELLLFQKLTDYVVGLKHLTIVSPSAPQAQGLWAALDLSHLKSLNLLNASAVLITSNTSIQRTVRLGVSVVNIDDTEFFVANFPWLTMIFPSPTVDFVEAVYDAFETIPRHLSREFDEADLCHRSAMQSDQPFFNLAFRSFMARGGFKPELVFHPFVVSELKKLRRMTLSRGVLFFVNGVHISCFDALGQHNWAQRDGSIAYRQYFLHGSRQSEVNMPTVAQCQVLADMEKSFLSSPPLFI